MIHDCGEELPKLLTLAKAEEVLPVSEDEILQLIEWREF